MDVRNTQERVRPSGRLFVVAGWVATILGMILWGYGYFATGTPSVIAWAEHLPTWAAEWLPNLESEIGLVLVVLGSIPLYWDMLRAK